MACPYREDSVRRQAAFQQRLQRVEEYCRPFLKVSNGAVIVENSHQRSIGVTRMLSNHYIPNESESAELDNCEDPTRQRNFFAFKPTLDAETYTRECEELGERRFDDTHGSYVELDTLFWKNHMVPVYEGEFHLGSNRIVCREKPEGGVAHLTGSIDMLKYNMVSGKLVLVELKTGSTSRSFFSMKQLFVKQKHVKQLQAYAYLLRNMFHLCGIEFNPENLELVIAGVDTSIRKVALWRVRYNPVVFLASSERWASLHDNIRLLSGDDLPCVQCAEPARYQDPKDTRLFYCSPKCREARRANKNEKISS